MQGSTRISKDIEGYARPSPTKRSGQKKIFYLVKNNILLANCPEFIWKTMFFYTFGVLGVFGSLGSWRLWGLSGLWVFEVFGSLGTWSQLPHRSGQKHLYYMVTKTYIHNAILFKNSSTLPRLQYRISAPPYVFPRKFGALKCFSEWHRYCQRNCMWARPA